MAVGVRGVTSVEICTCVLKFGFLDDGLIGDIFVGNLYDTLP